MKVGLDATGPRPGLGRGIEALVAALLRWPLRRISARARVACGHALGLALWAIDVPHRRLAQSNVTVALGVDASTARRITRGTFRHFGRVFAETLALSAYLDRRAESLFTIEGLEHLRAAHAQGRGVIVCSAHFGNWELVAQRQALLGVPMDFIARPLDNPWLERLLTAEREAAGNRVLGKHGALRRAVQGLKAGRGLAILIDQNTRTPPRLFVPFFGRPAATTPTAAQLSLRTGAPLVPVVSFPEGAGYRIRYHAALTPPAGADFDAQVVALTRDATRLIESWVRERPDVWLWLHDRWKSAPKPHETVES